jgi:hypothetical protein
MPHVAPALLVASGLVAALAGCEAVPASSRPPSPIAQTWVCGREYVNHAWGYVRYGTVIDRDGNVWRYNLRNMPANPDHPWNGSDTNHLSEDDLKARYNSATKANIQVSPDDIARHLPLIAEAANGKLTEPRMTAADMGEFVLYCYQYDATQHSYRQVILEQHGDLTMTNISQAAHDLASWIDKALGKDY